MPCAAIASSSARARAARSTTAANEVPGVVESTEYQGSYVKVSVDVGGDTFVANLGDADYFADPVDKGDPVIASWNAADVNVLAKADSGKAVDVYAGHGN